MPAHASIQLVGTASAPAAASVSGDATAAVGPSESASGESTPRAGSGLATRWLENLRESTPARSPLARQALAHVVAGSAESAVAVLESLLVHCEALLARESAAVRPREIALASERAVLLAQYRREIVAFLVEAQPGPVTELARTRLGERRALLGKLEYSIQALNHDILRELARR